MWRLPCLEGRQRGACGSLDEAGAQRAKPAPQASPRRGEGQATFQDRPLVTPWDGSHYSSLCPRLNLCGGVGSGGAWGPTSCQWLCPCIYLGLSPDGHHHRLHFSGKNPSDQWASGQMCSDVSEEGTQGGPRGLRGDAGGQERVWLGPGRGQAGRWAVASTSVLEKISPRGHCILPECFSWTLGSAVCPPRSLLAPGSWATVELLIWERSVGLLMERSP